MGGLNSTVIIGTETYDNVVGSPESGIKILHFRKENLPFLSF